MVKKLYAQTRKHLVYLFGRLYPPGKSGIQSTKLGMLFQTSLLSQEALLKTDICNFPNYLKINQIVLGINIHPPTILFIVFSLWRLLSPTGGKRAKWRRQSRQLASSCFSVAVVGCPGLLGMFPTFLNLTISSNILASSNVKVFASSSPTLAK